MVVFPARSKGYACTALLRLYQSQFPSSCQQLLRQEHTHVPPQEKATVRRLCHNFARHCALQVTYIWTPMTASHVCEYILVHMHRYTYACTPIYASKCLSTSYWHSFHYCSHDWHGKWRICVKDCFRLQNSVSKRKILGPLASDQGIRISKIAKTPYNGLWPPGFLPSSCSGLFDSSDWFINQFCNSDSYNLPGGALAASSSCLLNLFIHKQKFYV